MIEWGCAVGTFFAGLILGLLIAGICASAGRAERMMEDAQRRHERLGKGGAP